MFLKYGIFRKGNYNKPTWKNGFFDSMHMQASWGGAEREGDGESHTVSTEPDSRLELTNLWDHDLSQNQESDA